MKPAPFVYERPGSLEEALGLLEEHGEEATVIAGGQSLVPMMNLRLARPGVLVDINDIAGLTHKELREDGGVVVGALCRHVQIERWRELDGPWAGLRQAAGEIGHLPIRMRGTFGGSVAHSDPAAEWPVVCRALDGTVVAESRTGERRLLPAEFFRGPYTTALAPTEMITRVELAPLPANGQTAFEEVSERRGDFAMVSAAVALAREGEDCSWARIALGSVEAVPVRATTAEGMLVGAPLTEGAIDAAAQAASEECSPSDDALISAHVRRRLVRALVARALRRLLA